MRITSSMYYEGLYGNNNSKIQSKFFDINKQISSGLSIQYASDDVSAFSQTMRLDNEVTVLRQVKSSTDNGYKVSDHTDVILNEFESSLTKMRTLVISASNGTNDENSMDAIAAELRGIEDHLKSLANTSINGQFLFSGSAVGVKPINEDGTYNGNGESLNAFLGSSKEQQYNLSGEELFLGEEKAVNRKVTTNVANPNLILKYPQLKGDNGDGIVGLSENSSIRELMGDTDNSTTTSNRHFFYVRGVQSDGTAFNTKIEMEDTNKIDDLLNQIGTAYGNRSNLKLVNVTINSSGQIEIEDRMKGSSKLDFHMVGAVDFSGNGKANVSKIDDLEGGETNFDAIMKPTVTPKLYIKEFVRSPFSSADSTDISKTDALLYDRTQFTQNGDTLSSNVSQIVKGTNQFATSSTKISEVADISQTNAGTLDSTALQFSGKTISGKSFDVQFDFKSSANGGSTFNVDGTDYNIFNISKSRTATDADDVRYQQLLDVINMVVTDTLPIDETPEAYDNAVAYANSIGDTHLSDSGKISFTELNIINNTKARLAIHDVNSGDFSKDASVISFNTNNALTISDAKTDFFTTIDDIITSVENYKSMPNANLVGGDMRSLGMEHSLKSLDDLLNHVLKSHSQVGAQSNILSISLERTELLELTTMSLRSSVVDTDLAKASLELTQLSLNYEAMLSTVGRVSKLNLLNYL